MNKERKVWALTKLNADGHLATDHRFSFPATGTTYLVREDGSIRNVSRPSKAERRAARKGRR